MRIRRFLTIAIATLALVFAGCSSSKESEKEDESQTESETKKQESEKEEHPGDEKEGEEHPGDKKEGEEHPGDEKKDEKKDKDKEGEEHPGDDKEGEEHPGEEGEEGKEGEEHPGDEANYTASDIKTAMRNHIESESSDGVFTIDDEKTGETLKLKFVKIHDPVREMPEKGYFGCTDFHVKGSKKKVYDLDFWLEPKDGSLKVYKSKVHKHPVKKDGEWVKKARYTFKNDKIVKVD